MLDSGSDASLIRVDIAHKLGLKGKSNSLLFGTFHGAERVKSTMVSFKISAIDESFTFEVNNAFTIPILNASRKIDNWKIIKKFVGKIIWHQVVISPSRRGYSFDWVRHPWCS